jgi:hypothetical protein
VSNASSHSSRSRRAQWGSTSFGFHYDPSANELVSRGSSGSLTNEVQSRSNSSSLSSVTAESPAAQIASDLEIVLHLARSDSDSEPSVDASSLTLAGSRKNVSARSAPSVFFPEPTESSPSGRAEKVNLPAHSSPSSLSASSSRQPRPLSKNWAVSAATESDDDEDEEEDVMLVALPDGVEGVVSELDLGLGSPRKKVKREFHALASTGGSEKEAGVVGRDSISSGRRTSGGVNGRQQSTPIEVYGYGTIPNRAHADDASGMASVDALMASRPRRFSDKSRVSGGSLVSDFMQAHIPKNSFYHAHNKEDAPTDRLGALGASTNGLHNLIVDLAIAAPMVAFIDAWMMELKQNEWTYNFDDTK